MRPGAWLVWLDTNSPQYRKELFERVGLIGLSGSTNQRYRVIAIFQRI
jgi:hypothetical protein